MMTRGGEDGGLDATTLTANAAFMDKYSRQIGAYGIEAMSRLIQLKVLIVGLKGVGIEAAKNLILAGPGAVTLHDDQITEVRDLGSNFFLTEADVGKPRAAACVDKLSELNSMVTVRVSTGPLEEAMVASHNVVVMSDGSLAEAIRWDDFCHQRCIAFVWAGVRGAASFVFSDFGPSFTVRDITGENPVTRIITHIENDEQGTVTLLPQDDGGRAHGIEESEHDGWVEISDVTGMETIEDTAKSINDTGPFKIKHVYKTVIEILKDGSKKEKKVFDGFKLAIGDTRGYTPYQNGGVLTQVKKPVAFSYRTLRDNVAQPVGPGEFSLLFTDGAKFGRAEQLHIALQGLWKFEEQYARRPTPNSDADAEEVLRLARERNEELKKLGEAALSVEDLDADVVTKLALYAALDLQPLAAFLGGVVAQEVVKFTGKFQPLRQWLHLDAFEVIPSERPRDTAPQGSRYDDLIQLLGASLHDTNIANGRTFIVGCGALGCEYLKNFAMLGLATGPQGRIHVTDNDRIEVSNLNRQFLFREHNVGQPKSVAAANAAAHMNSAMKIDAKESLVAPTTENIFNDPFWESLHFVTNALDNVKARLYVDTRCVFYEKPLLESGTLGTKCNVQVIIPHVTASYADGPKDQADEDNIPMCTLRNFPSLIEHCIEWARAQFNDMFMDRAAEAKKFLGDRGLYLSEAKAALTASRGQDLGKKVEGLTRLKEYLGTSRTVSFDKCMAEAFMLFHTLFRDKLLQLVHEFPEDCVTSSGERFWAGAKRFPQAAHFDLDNEQHMGFIVSTANILAVNYGLVPPPEKELLGPDHEFRQPQVIKRIIGSLRVPGWTPSSEKTDLGESKEGENGGQSQGKEDDDAMDVDSVTQADDGEERARLQRLIQELEGYDTKGLSIEPADFEKDQDLNFHIDFITAAANLRAANYRIKQASRHKCKMIAGKIIPAIATATASVTGLACIELLKVLQKKPLEAYKDSSNNLGLNMYFMQEPAPPVKAKERYDDVEMAYIKPYPEGYTKWDKIVIDRGVLTMRGFIEAFKQQTGLNITLLFHSATELEGPQKGRFLYNRDEYTPANRALYESKLDTDLKEWVLERYVGAPVEVVGQFRKYLELQMSAEDDGGQVYTFPTVVYRWAH